MSGDSQVIAICLHISWPIRALRQSSALIHLMILALCKSFIYLLFLKNRSIPFPGRRLLNVIKVASALFSVTVYFVTDTHLLCGVRFSLSVLSQGLAGKDISEMTCFVLRGM